MANEKNLIPLGSRTQRERNEIALKGAEASNKAQRAKKQLKHQFELLMSMELEDSFLKEQITQYGLCDGRVTVENAMCVAITQRALKR